MVALKLPFDAPQMQQLVFKIIHDQVFKIHRWLDLIFFSVMLEGIVKFFKKILFLFLKDTRCSHYKFNLVYTGDTLYARLSDCLYRILKHIDNKP